MGGVGGVSGAMALGALALGALASGALASVTGLVVGRQGGGEGTSGDATAASAAGLGGGMERVGGVSLGGGVGRGAATGLGAGDAEAGLAGGGCFGIAGGAAAGLGGPLSVGSCATGLLGLAAKAAWLLAPARPAGGLVLRLRYSLPLPATGPAVLGADGEGPPAPFLLVGPLGKEEELMPSWRSKSE